MNSKELAFKPAVELRELIVNKEISPVELTQVYLDRIDKLDQNLNSFITTIPEQAIKDAQSAEKAVMDKKPLGPLHGIPISIKDLESTKGIKTTMGSLVFKNKVPQFDSIVVERIRESGAVILGKTNTPEFGLLGSTENRLGTSDWENHCRNPWNTEMTSGGSSGGAAAAISAGLCALATGSDGGGSIRIPASFCGVYGIKPTLGTIPRYPGVPTIPIANQTSQAGPITRSVKDSSMLLNVLSGHDERDPISLKINRGKFMNLKEGKIDKLRIGWVEHFGFGQIDKEIASICKKTVNLLQQIANVELVKIDIGDPFEAFWTLFSTNVFASYRKIYDNSSSELSWYTQKTLELGSTVSGTDYAHAIGEIDVIKSKFSSIFESFDLILTPTTSVPAFPVGNPPTKINNLPVDEFWGAFPNTFPINMIGYPAASIPCGFTKNKLPIGLHLIGRPNAEPTILSASLELESINPWIQELPLIS